jgi:hypothetical protein
MFEQLIYPAILRGVSWRRKSLFDPEEAGEAFQDSMFSGFL